MKRLSALVLGLCVAAIGFGGNCSRARVESMNMMNEGVVYAQTKRYVEAVEKLERATALDATNDQAFYNLALVHIETSAYERAISVDGWNWEVSSIGNVLWTPTTSLDVDRLIWEPGLGTNPLSGVAVYLLGSNAWDPAARRKVGADFGDNGMAFRHFHRHLDFDYFTQTQYVNPNNPERTLPPSLYLESKPDFFGSEDWPWVDPAGASHAERIKVLPAKARYDSGNP